jgi:SAM-dependent methyltransferase
VESVDNAREEAAVSLHVSARQVNKAIDTYVTSAYEKVRAYERFHFLADLVAERLPDAGSVLDIGCAKGEFIFHLRERFPSCRFTGLEYSTRLLELARNEPRLQGVEFVEGDAASFDLGRRFDVAVMAGVLSTFDDYEPPLARMVDHLKPGGYGYVFGGFTSADVDVIVRYRNNAMGSRDWSPGLNMFSLHTIRAALEPAASSIRHHEFRISQPLPRSEDPIKSFTVTTESGEKLILNGANIVREFYALEFQKRRS